MAGSNVCMDKLFRDARTHSAWLDRPVTDETLRELYNALKRQGVPVKMVTYPRQPHGIQEPKLMLDAMNRNLEWFDRFLKGSTRSNR